MHLSPHEQERLLISSPPSWPGAAGRAGCELNYPEATRSSPPTCSRARATGARRRADGGRAHGAHAATTSWTASPRCSRRCRWRRPSRTAPSSSPSTSRSRDPRARSSPATGASRRINAGAPRIELTCPTPATGRCRSARTTTSPRPTRRWSSTGRPRAGHRLAIAGRHRRPLRAGHHPRRSTWCRSAAPAIVPGLSARTARRTLEPPMTEL